MNSSQPKKIRFTDEQRGTFERSFQENNWDLVYKMLDEAEELPMEYTELNLGGARQPTNPQKQEQ